MNTRKKRLDPVVLWEALRCTFCWQEKLQVFTAAVAEFMAIFGFLTRKNLLEFDLQKWGCSYKCSKNELCLRLAGGPICDILKTKEKK